MLTDETPIKASQKMLDISNHIRKLINSNMDEISPVEAIMILGQAIGAVMAAGTFAEDNAIEAALSILAHQVRIGYNDTAKSLREKHDAPPRD